MPESLVDRDPIVRLARERSLDDAPELALLLLREAYPEIAESDLIEVLVGRSRVIQHADAPPEAVVDKTFTGSWHRDEVARHYSSHVRIGGAWYQAYGAVTDLGEKDMEARIGLTRAQVDMAFQAWAGEQGSGAASEASPENLDLACRPMHYAKRPLQDRVLYLDTGPESQKLFRKGRCPPRIAVLFRPVAGPPPWATVANDPQEAFDAGLTEGHVYRRGHADRWEPKEEDEEEECFPPPRPIPPARPFVPIPYKPDGAGELDYEALKAHILRQAEDGAGFLTLDWGEGPVRVPRAPFERWALRPSGMGSPENLKLAPPWENVCPASMKMAGDNQDHSDWMLGAGLEADAMYTSFLKRGQDGERAKRIRDAAETAVAEVQRVLLGRKHAVLSGSGQVSGPVWIGVRGETPLPGSIVVVVSASPDWLPAVIEATSQGGGGLVVERGGALAHLISELRARAVPILRWPGATKELYDGVPLRLDLDHGLAEVLPHRLELDSDEPFARSP